MFYSFPSYLKEVKSNFDEARFDDDANYRAVMFRRYGVSYRWFCERHRFAGDYVIYEMDVRQYEHRIGMYRNQ